MITGAYTCTLTGQLDYRQKGVVNEANIRQAPVVQLQSELNVRCADGATQQLRCCVQRPFTVKWFRDGGQLNSGKTKLLFLAIL